MVDEPTATGKLAVFISYSRDDLSFADQLHTLLAYHGFASILDRHGISAGEDWRRRLGNLIRDADTVAFVLSPSSAQSEICKWETAEAIRLGKRIIPVVCRSLGSASAPQELNDLNFIFFYDEPKAPGSGFGSGLIQLITALNTDLEWLREHTRLLLRASEWEAGQRSTNRLLSGADVEAAKDWAARRPANAPEPTALHFDFIKASELVEIARTDEVRQQLAAIAVAQSEREIALRKEKAAFEQVAQAHRRGARVRNVALAAVSAFALVMAGLWSWANKERNRAEAENAAAESILNGATGVLSSISAREQSTGVAIFNAEEKRHAFATFKSGAEHGSVVAITNLCLAYARGFGVAKDAGLARQWCRRGVERGDSEAMWRLGALYEGGEGGAIDHEAAFKLFEQSAQKGNLAGLFFLGGAYVDGHGVARDYGKGLECYEKAFEGGLHQAISGISQLEALDMAATTPAGIGIDRARLRKFAESASARGAAEAMTLLGDIYADGYGVSQDDATARSWYEKAAARGHSRAMYLLGAIFAHARGVARDDAAARSWYEKAAAKNDRSAIEALAEMKKRGVANPPDPARNN